MMLWLQNYDPFGQIVVSTLVKRSAPRSVTPPHRPCPAPSKPVQFPAQHRGDPQTSACNVGHEGVSSHRLPNNPTSLRLNAREWGVTYDNDETEAPLPPVPPTP